MSVEARFSGAQLIFAKTIQGSVAAYLAVCAGMGTGVCSEAQMVEVFEYFAQVHAVRAAERGEVND